MTEYHTFSLVFFFERRSIDLNHPDFSALVMVESSLRASGEILGLFSEDVLFNRGLALGVDNRRLVAMSGIWNENIHAFVKHLHIQR